VRNKHSKFKVNWKPKGVHNKNKNFEIKIQTGLFTGNHHGKAFKI